MQLDIHSPKKRDPQSLKSQKGGFMNVVQVAVQLFKKDDPYKLVKFCEICLEVGDVSEKELWKLYGIGLAQIGKPVEARKALICANKLDPKDMAVMLNLMTSYFQAGLGKEGLEVLRNSLNFVPDSLLEGIEHNLSQALEDKIISISDIPEKIRVLKRR